MAIENTAFVASTFNDIQSFGNLRSGALLRQSSEDARNLVDQLELSPESLQLAQQNDNLVPTEETVPGIAENDSETGFNLESDVTTNTPASDLLAAVNAEANESPESTGAVPAGTAATPPADLEAAPTVPEPAPIPTPGIETTLAGFAASESEQATAAARAAEAEAPPSPAVESTTLGSVEAGQPAAPPAPAENETAVALEEQTNDVQRINSFLNSINGTPRETPASPAEPAVQAEQYQQQVLLQNVGTQLAQTVPPANVVSVLG